MQIIADRPYASAAIRTDLGAIFISLKLNLSTMPIRLSPTPTKCGVYPFPGIQPVKGRRGYPARDTHQRAERVERVEAPIEPEREFVEIGLQMFFADPVMDAVDPTLQIGKDQVDDRQEFLRDLRVAAYGDWMVVKSAISQASISTPVIGDDQRSGNNGVFDESA